MTTRRPALLTVLVVGGFVLVAAGVLIAVAAGGAARVIGIVAAVLGLACLRAAFWTRKVRRLTEVGLDLHRRSDDEPGP